MKLSSPLARRAGRRRPLVRKPRLEQLEDRLAPAVIQGTLWQDTNQNGIHDAGEPALAGRTVFLDTNHNGSLDSGESSQTTAADGSYSFSGLAGGSYAVAALAPAGWVTTTPRAPLAVGSLAPSLWRSLGPAGGDAVATAVSPKDPSVVLAAFASDTYHGGLFRSTDGGATWLELPAFTETPVLAVAIAANGTMYAGTYNGLLRSTDNGVNWTLMEVDGQTQNIVLTLTAHPTDANTLYVGLNPGFGEQPSTLWKTTDGGVSWTDITPFYASGLAPTRIGLDPANPSNVYAAYGGSLAAGGIFYSPDGGASWYDRRIGLPPGQQNNAVWDVAFDASGGVLIAGGLQFGSQQLGVYRSADDGLTWVPLATSGPLSFARAVVVNQAGITVGTETDGVYHSGDGGQTWSPAPGTSGVQINELVLSGANVVAVGTAQGVLRSTDSGSSFVQSVSGISEFDVYAAAVNPNDPNDLALAYSGLNNGGVLSSHDGGQSWHAEPLPPVRWHLVKFGPDGTLYAVTDGPTYNGLAEGLYRRNADGSWTSIGPNFQEHLDADVRAIAFSPTDPNVLLAAGQTLGSSDPNEQQHATIWLSPDAGATWQRVWLGPDWATHVSDIDFLAGGATLLASVYDDANQVPQTSTVLRSTDGGLTWAASTTGLPTNVQANALAPSATNPNKVYLANGYAYQTGAVYVSTDAGQTWAATNTSNAVSSAGDLLVDPADDRILYAGATRSEDGGVTFAPFDQGLNNGPPLPYGRPALSYAGGAAPRLVIATRGGVYATELYSTKTPPRTVTVADADTASGIDFGSRPAWGEISGTIFEDTNGDGVWQPLGEFARSGWTVYVDANNNGQIDPGEPSYRTSGWGTYQFTGLEPGTYTVRLWLQPGYRQTGPVNNGGYTVTVGAGGSVSGKDFGFQSLPTELHGTKWNDANGNGVFDSGESPVSGWTMYLDQNGNGTLDPGEPTAVTDAQGNYAFTVPGPGTYLVAEVQPAYWQQTAPGDGHSTYDAGRGYGPPSGAWRDHDPSTPNVIDVWYDYRPYNGYANQITAAEQADAEAAMARWEQATGGKLHFSRNTTAPMSDIIDIGTGDLAAVGDVSQQGGTLGRGGAASDGSGGLTDGIAWMDQAETWDTTIGDGTQLPTVDYFSIVLHEFGHAIGMEHAENLPWDVVMAPIYSHEYAGLTAVDVDQVRHDYGGANAGAGFRVVKVARGDVRTGLDFGSKQLDIPFNNLALDFGTDTSPVASGYTRTTAGTTYSTTRGYGWSAGTLTGVDRGTSDSLTRDFVSTNDATFVVDVPNGTYQVTATLGDASTSRDQMAVYLEGGQVENVNTSAGQFSTQTFTVTVTDRQLTIRFVDLGNGRKATAGVALDALKVVRVLPSLSVSVSPGTFSEAAGANAATGTVTRSGDLSQPLTVTLTSNDTTEATVPATVTIPAGQSSVKFAVAAVDDTLSDGSQTVTISVSASGYNGGSTTVTVTDNEPPQYAALSLDFGTSSSPVASGFKQVTATTTYTTSLGYGWLSGTIQEVDRKGGNLSAVNRDFNETSDGTFAVSVGAGTYSVTITMGDAKAAHDNMGVWLEGVQVDTVSTAAGQFVRKTYSVTVSDGQLTLRLRDLGGSDPFAVINALEISRTSSGSLRAMTAAGPIPWRLLLPPSPAGVAAEPAPEAPAPAASVGEGAHGSEEVRPGTASSSPARPGGTAVLLPGRDSDQRLAWLSDLLGAVTELWGNRRRR